MSKSVNPIVASDFATQLLQLLKTLKLHLKKAQDCYKAFAHKFTMESSSFQIDNKIWLI